MHKCLMQFQENLCHLFFFQLIFFLFSFFFFFFFVNWVAKLKTKLKEPFTILEFPFQVYFDKKLPNLTNYLIKLLNYIKLLYFRWFLTPVSSKSGKNWKIKTTSFIVFTKSVPDFFISAYLLFFYI